MKSTAKGYNASRNIGWQSVPQRVQNLVIRTYAQKRGLTFTFSFSEYSMPDTYMILDAVVRDEFSSLSDFIFYSIGMLPVDRKHRAEIFQIALREKCSLHFALEELSITVEQDVEYIEEIIMCRQLATSKKR